MLLPIRERSVVQKNRMAKRARGKKHRRCLLSNVAVSDNGVVGLNARLREQRTKLIDRLQLTLSIVHFGVGNALGAGNMSWPSSVVASARNAIVERSIARVDDRYAGALLMRADVVRVDDDRPQLELRQ